MTVMNEAGGRSVILVVDDEPTLRMAFAFALENDATHVVQANDGRDALDLLAHGRVDIVLMDLRMPQLNGIETVEQMRASGDLTPVILCSAHFTPEDALRALRCGVVDFLTKPVELAHLREKVASILQPPFNPWADALAHARRMDFAQAVKLLRPLVDTEEQTVWADTFLTLASPEANPAGFFDPASGRHRIERLMLAH